MSPPLPITRHFLSFSQEWQAIFLAWPMAWSHGLVDANVDTIYIHISWWWSHHSASNLTGNQGLLAHTPLSFTARSTQRWHRDGAMESWNRRLRGWKAPRVADLFQTTEHCMREIPTYSPLHYVEKCSTQHHASDSSGSCCNAVWILDGCDHWEHWLINVDQLSLPHTPHYTTAGHFDILILRRTHLPRVRPPAMLDDASHKYGASGGASSLRCRKYRWRWALTVSNCDRKVVKWLNNETLNIHYDTLEIHSFVFGISSFGLCRKPKYPWYLEGPSIDTKPSQLLRQGAGEATGWTRIEW